MKVKHYARPVTQNATSTNFEALIIEITIGIICGIYAYMGYGAQVGQLFYPCLIVAIICFLLVSHTLYSVIREKIRAKRDTHCSKD